MTFRDRVKEIDGGRWEIPLATHFGTKIENETSPPLLKLSLSRQQTEEKFKALWKCIRKPTAGYNCFGQVFASRRTGIYGLEYVDKIIKIILAEDGFEEIQDEKAYHEGDVVLYEDQTGYTHAARIIRFEELKTQLADVADAVRPRVAIVLSKLNEISGEFEHQIEDFSWAVPPVNVTYRVFRDRNATPKTPEGWRAKIITVGG